MSENKITTPEKTQTNTESFYKKQANMYRILLAFMIICLGVTNILYGTRVLDRADELREGGFRFEDNGKNATAIRYYGSETEIIMPETVDGYTITRIDKKVFSGDKSIVSVTLPQTAWYIDDEAFMFCVSLEKVVLPTDASIGNEAFYCCTSLSDIDLSGVEYLGESAFEGCDSLRHAELSNVTIIRERAFMDCKSLESVNLAGVLYILDYAFADCKSLSEITLPESVRTVGDRAFADCTSLASVTLSGAVDIGDGAFRNCTSLTEITLPDAEMRIGDYAFEGCPATIYAPREPEWYGLVPGDYDGEWVIV